jgi:hypothetical protein
VENCESLLRSPKSNESLWPDIESPCRTRWPPTISCSRPKLHPSPTMPNFSRIQGVSGRFAVVQTRGFIKCTTPARVAAAVDDSWGRQRAIQADLGLTLIRGRPTVSNEQGDALAKTRGLRPRPGPESWPVGRALPLAPLLANLH